MKNVFFCILVMVMVACATTKKSVQSKETASIAVETIESKSMQGSKLIDTTKTEKGKITITEIEFYPPKDDSNGKKKSPPKVSNASGIYLLNIGNIGNAAIKSIKQTVIENETEKKGESKESSSKSSFKSEAVLANSNKEVQNVVSPAPDPYRWRYIFYSLLLVVIAFLYLNVPVLNWIKTILSNLRRIF